MSSFIGRGKRSTGRCSLTIHFYCILLGYLKCWEVCVSFVRNLRTTPATALGGGRSGSPDPQPWPMTTVIFVQSQWFFIFAAGQRKASRYWMPVGYFSLDVWIWLPSASSAIVDKAACSLWRLCGTCYLRLLKYCNSATCNCFRKKNAMHVLATTVVSYSVNLMHFNVLMS